MKTIEVLNLYQSTDTLKVFLFNVGQGDHILLKFPNHNYGLIDFFYSGDENILEPPALSYFKSLKTTLSAEEFQKITISFVCISHTDKDHIKGICETIKWFDKAGIFIKEFWLGAARDEAQLMNFLQTKVDSIIKQLPMLEMISYSKRIEAFRNGINGFFHSFDNWKKGKFLSSRYKSEEFGQGEYLVDIKPLSLACSGTEALNVGPLGHHLDKYINGVTLESIMKLLCLKVAGGHIDKNILSHILQIKFGETKLLFGGDTDKEIWEECLQRYQKPGNTYRKHFGEIASHFIKVSHHGSKESSSAFIWETIIPKEGVANLGISAGRHKGYYHPHSETMIEIRNCRNDAKIFSTNICDQCIFEETEIAKEEHIWYDKYIMKKRWYQKANDSVENEEIERIIHATFDETDNNTSNRLGLFAYIFDIPAGSTGEIKTSLALTRTNKSSDCFYFNHSEKLRDQCRKKLPME